MENHQHCFLYNHCLSEWRLLIEAQAKIHVYKKGESIFKVGEAAKGFYFIHEGKVKIHKKWKNNRDLILKLAGEGDILGHRGMLDAKHPVSATALNKVTLCFISTDFFKTTLMVNHQLSYQMVLFFADELHKIEQSMWNMVHKDVKSRIAEALCSVQEIFGIDKEGYIHSPLSKQDIAAYAGTTYESLFKTLNEWKLAGIIDLSEKKIAIKNIVNLKKLTVD